MMPLAQVTTIQLTTVRALLEHASAALTDGGPVGAGVALLVADVALETLVKQVLADQGTKIPSEANVHDLLTLLKKARPTLANRPELETARRLRAARNPVQHAGSVPNEAAVVAHVRDAQEFARVVALDAYGVELAQVSLTALIKSPELKDALTGAEQLLTSGEVDNACIHVAAAFGLLFSRCGSWIRLIMGVTDVEERFTAALAHPAVLTVFPSHPDGVTPNTEHESWREVALLSLGFPLPDLLSLKAIEMRSEAIIDAQNEGRIPPDDAPAVEAVLHAIDVLARHIWRIETAAPAVAAGGVPRDSAT